MSSLDGKKVLVVGASSGIGEAIARGLGKEKVSLVLAARRVDRLDQIGQEIMAAGNAISAESLQLDVCDREAVKKCVSGVDCDVLINVAGVMYFQLLKNQAWEHWDQMIDINCKGVVYCCGAVLPGMLKKGSGCHIVNISSDAAQQTFPALSVYNASKSFVHEFTKGLRAECVGTGVRITEILPGDVRTDLIKKNTDSEAATKVGVSIGAKIGGEDFKADSEGRSFYLDPEDVADVVMYALKAPAHVGVHELLIEPRDQMWGDPTSMAVSSDPTA